MKKVWTPNINIPTIPLNRATYLAPPTPNELLKTTGNGKPYFCEGLPTRLAKIATSVPANKHDAKTTRKSSNRALYLADSPDFLK